MRAVFRRPRRPEIAVSRFDQQLLLMLFQAKMMSLLEDWRNLLSHQKQVGSTHLSLM